MYGNCYFAASRARPPQRDWTQRARGGGWQTADLFLFFFLFPFLLFLPLFSVSFSLFRLFFSFLSFLFLFSAVIQTMYTHILSLYACTNFIYTYIFSFFKHTYIKYTKFV